MRKTIMRKIPKAVIVLEAIRQLLLSDGPTKFLSHLDLAAVKIMDQTKQTLTERNQHTCLSNQHISSGILTRCLTELVSSK
jgi:hypothetical protein